MHLSGSGLRTKESSKIVFSLAKHNRLSASYLIRILVFALVVTSLSGLPRAFANFGPGNSVTTCNTNLSTLTSWNQITKDGLTTEPRDDQQVMSGSGIAGDMFTGSSGAAAFWKIDANCAYFKVMLDTNPLSDGRLQANTQYLMSLGTAAEGAKAWVGVAVDGGGSAGNAYVWATNSVLSGGKYTTGTTFYFSKLNLADTVTTATNPVYVNTSSEDIYVAWQMPLSAFETANVSNGVGLFVGTASNSSLSAINNDCYGDNDAAGHTCDVTAATFSTTSLVFLSDTYDIIYKQGTNGSGTEQTQTKNIDVDLTLANSTTANTWFTRTGFEVIGWSTTDLGTKN